MAGIGDVLRGLGSVLNPQVAAGLEQEQLQRNQQQQQMGMMALQEQAAQRRTEQQQAFASAENGRKIAAQYQQHMDELKQRAADKAAQIAQQAAEGRITRQEADQRAADLRRELQDQAARFRVEFAQLAAGLRPAPQPQLITNENGIFQVGRDGKAVPVVGPDNKPLPGKPQAPEKALPAAAAKALLENQQNLRRADQALQLIQGNDLGSMKGDKNATGFKGYLGEAILQRADPEGIDARAAMADLGSLVIHDRSGAAVTASEFPRLRPFIPQVTDDPETVKKKLERFKQVYQQVVDDTKEFYRESGYKVPDTSLGGKPAAPAQPSPKPKGANRIKLDANGNIIQ